MDVQCKQIGDIEWEVFNPEAEYEILGGRGADRLKDLKNRKIGLLWNGKPNGNVLLEAVGNLLKQQFDKLELINFNRSIGIGQKERERIARSCDAVIAAVADCGSCTSHLFRDSVGIEKLGTLVVVIATGSFIEEGRWIAEAEGLSSLVSVEIPHPLAGLSKETIRERSRSIIGSIVSGLQSGPLIPGEDNKRRIIKPEPKSICMSGRSKTEVLHKINQFFYDHKWTDGFPIVPPDREAVEWMLRGTHRNENETIGLVPPKWGKATIRNIAINAVMAGCEPAYMPVIVAAVEALTDLAFAASVETSWGTAGMQTTTGPITPFLIINGPVASDLKMASGVGCLGPGNRTNATIGRAIRLILINTGGAQPGTNDMKCHGSAWQFTFCVAEREEHPAFRGTQKTWKPLNVERGFTPGTSTVTVAATWPPINVEEGIGSGHDILNPIVDTMSTFGQLPHDREWEYMVVLNSTHAQYLAESGWSKDDIREYIYANSVMPWGKYKMQCYPNRNPAWVYRTVEDSTSVHILESPRNVTIIVAGGESQYSYLVRCVHRSVTKEIECQTRG